jgi:hypothetical protein
MNLVFESYTSSNPVREAELSRVREINAQSGVFKRIVPVADGGRKTYAELCALAVDRFPGEVCVIANSDIAFDASLAGAAEWLRHAQKPSLVALSRWDTPTSPSMEGRVDHATWKFFSHSQDTWMFIAGSLPKFNADFTLGIPACESRLAYEAHTAGVVIANPALTVRTWHHHASAVRSWKLADSYKGPLFFPRLTTLEGITGEGFILDRTGWRTRKEVVCGESPPKSGTPL